MVTPARLRAGGIVDLEQAHGQAASASLTASRSTKLSWQLSWRLRTAARPIRWANPWRFYPKAPRIVGWPWPSLRDRVSEGRACSERLTILYHGVLRRL